MSGERMKFARGQPGAEKLRSHFELRARFNPAFDPHLGRAMVLPVREKADAVTGSENFVKMFLKLIERQVLIHHLPGAECGLNRQRDLRDHSQSAERYNCAVKAISIFRA